MSIERRFDVSLIAELALREKQIQQNYRPIIGVHKWFARRPGTLFRGLLLAEFGQGRLAHLYHPSDNLVSHHAVMMDGTGEWHYKCVFEDRLHECLADPSRSGLDAQGIVDRLLGRLGAGRLAHVHGAPVGTAEGGGNALLAFEDAP